MGILDKIKNMFTEEVEEEVKVEQIKKDIIKETVETAKVKEEELADFKFEVEESISKPVFFDDNDFRDLNLDERHREKIEEKPKEKEIYGSKIQEPVIEKKSFKPTPIISPVYGVLNKNYHKEDIVSRSDVKLEKDVSISSIDAIRNKAYGTLEDELENTLFGSNSILFKKDNEDVQQELEVKEVSDDILTDLTDDISKELDELLIRKEKYVDDREEDEVSNINDEDLLGFIDSTLYKDGDEE